VAADNVAKWLGLILAAVAATVVWIWFVRSVGRLLRSAVSRIEELLHSRGKGISVRNVEVLSVDTIIGFCRSLIGSARVVIILLVTYVWLLLVAWLLGSNTRVFDVVVRPLITAFSTAATATFEFIPDLAMLVVIFVLARFSVRVVRVLTEAVGHRRLELDWLDPELAVPTRRIATIVIWGLSLVMAAPHLPGSDSKAFLGIAIMLGILLSIGGTSVTSNLLGGLMVTYSRAYRVGDRVIIGEHSGKIISVGALTTRLRTEEGREVIIPNAVVQASTITHLDPRSHKLSTVDAFELLPRQPSLTPSPPSISVPPAPPVPEDVFTSPLAPPVVSEPGVSPFIQTEPPPAPEVAARSSAPPPFPPAPVVKKTVPLPKVELKPKTPPKAPSVPPLPKKTEGSTPPPNA
jgi:small-conductance mechanosensitive channel